MDSKKVENNFVMVGYSFGSILAIELTHRLEKMNIQGRVVLIDGAPAQLKALIRSFAQCTTSDEIQNILLLAISDVLIPAGNKKVWYYN